MTYLKTEGHKKCSEFVRYAADKISDIKWKDVGYGILDWTNAELNECGFLISDCRIKMLDLKPKFEKIILCVYLRKSAS
jgi:hypothetical protein